MMNIYTITFVAAITGSIIALASSLITSKIKHQQSVSNKLLDKYFEIRKELVDTLSTLSAIKINKKISDEEMMNYQIKVAKLYYKCIDFLPNPILDSLIMLHACLINKQGKLYKIKNNVVLSRSKIEINSFFKEFVRYKNVKIYAISVLNDNRINNRHNQAIKLHAQYVLFNLKQFATRKNFIEMVNKLQKLDAI